MANWIVAGMQIKNPDRLWVGAWQQAVFQPNYLVILNEPSFSIAMSAFRNLTL